MRTIRTDIPIRDLMAARGLQVKAAVVEAEAVNHSTARFQFKAAKTKNTFSGLASTWEKDLGGDMIEQGAYTRTLKQWRRDGYLIPLINQHSYFDTRSAIGKMLSAEETDEGLDTEWKVVESADGEEFMARIREGILNGLSIGYQTRGWREPTENEQNRGIFRVLTDVELREVSVVIWGMNPGALIDQDSVKSIRTIAAALAAMSRDTLSEDDRKAIREVASLCGGLLRAPDTPAPDKAPPAPTVPPGKEVPADGQTAYPHADHLRTRITAIGVERAIRNIRY